MRNIFLFIRRYFNFLVFFLLQALCIFLIVQYSNYHQAMFGGMANTITGNINSRYDNMENYFKLKKTNDSLVSANEKLYNRLAADFNLPDTVDRQAIDTIQIDSFQVYRKISYLSAKVVSNSVSNQSNFLVLHSPNVVQMKVGMGVVGPNNCAVGVITDIDGEFAVVMSLLHKDSRISGKLLKTGETGTITWDGKSPNLLTLTNIPKSTRLVKGDSVITSGFSTIFPKGILIGRVEQVFRETETNNFKIIVRTAANFHNLEYAYVINNVQQETIKKLLDKAKALSK